MDAFQLTTLEKYSNQLIAQNTTKDAVTLSVSSQKIQVTHW
jgi:hypothetical protein